MSARKVIIVTNVPNPYRIPLFNEVHAQLLKEGIELKVLFGSENYARRKYRLNLAECSFTYDFLDSSKYNFGDEEKTYFTYKGLMRALSKENPHCIVMSGFSIGTTRLFFQSFFRKINFIIWSGAIQRKGRNDSIVRRLQRRFIASRAGSFIAYGSLAKSYLEGLGAPPKKIHVAINTVDTSFFSLETNTIRKELGPDPVKRLTYIGYLSPRKNVSLLLDILHELSHKRKDFVLDLIGEGEDKPNLEKFVQMNSMADFVHFHGFKQKSELPAFLARSNCFLFQTDFDIWGLVLNEAMAAALPCISSVNAGASADLVKDGETGFVVDFRDKELAKKKIEWILDNPEEAKIMGLKAKAFIEREASIQVSARGFVKAILQGLS